MTYQSLAEKYNVSSNAIKKRIDKLIETGVIERFTIRLSWAMLDAEPVLSFLYTDKSGNAMQLIDEIGANPLVHMVGFDSYGSWDVSASYRDANDLSKLGDFLRSFESVKSVEMHPLCIKETGKKVEFNKLELRVIATLVEDARMSISEIAEKTGLTSRRVRRILTNLMENGGVRFTTDINWNAGDQTRVSFRVKWDGKKVTREQIMEKVRKKYPDEFIEVYPSSIESLMWIEFMINHMRNAKDIANWLTLNTSVKVMGTIIPYPRKRFPGLQETRLQELLSEINQ
jgi:DNA-binding Lrp family transcriptional regulator